MHQELIKAALVKGIAAANCCGDFTLDICHRPENAFAAVPRRIAIAEFDCLIRTF
jgi:hypothetical protein